MEIVIQLLDELDDVFAPMVAMASATDVWRVGSLAAAAAAAAAFHSPLMLAGGVVLAVVADVLPAA
ncbi:MAG: hypothetical protein AAGD86_03620 [Pseudomonadota bacterium]